MSQRTPRFTRLAIPEVILIAPKVHRDARGFFVETHNQRLYTHHGVDAVFVQDNASLSARNILRGLHAQVKNPQAKLVRVVSGEIFDVAVDIRRGSPTFGQWVGASLSAENFHQLYVPPGFAHGFCVTSETALVSYKVSTFYDPQDEIAIAHDDPAIGIDWPLNRPVLSDRDANAAALFTFHHQLSVWRPPA
jgi:dTDP-4-dehydrorhamnose 3,5-epimerase